MACTWPAPESVTSVMLQQFIQPYHGDHGPASAPDDLSSGPRDSAGFCVGIGFSDLGTGSEAGGDAHPDSAAAGFLRDAAAVGRAPGRGGHLPAVSDGDPTADDDRGPAPR